MAGKVDKHLFEDAARAKAGFLGHDLGNFATGKIFVNFWTADCRHCGASATYAIGDPAGTLRGPALVGACPVAQSIH